MKKVWVLERKYNEIDKEILEELKTSHPEIKVENKEYFEVVKVANYYKFCSAVKKEFGRADKFAIDELKKTLPNDGVYTNEIALQYKQTHNKVKDSYRIIQGEVDDDVKDYSNYKFIKNCDDVKRYLWGCKV